MFSEAITAGYDIEDGEYFSEETGACKKCFHRTSRCYLVINAHMKLSHLIQGHQELNL